MLKKNPERSRSREHAPASTDKGGWRPFRPDSYVTLGVQVERLHIPAGMIECQALPFLIVGVQDGPAVKVTQEGGGRSRNRMSVIGEAEICPPGFSEGAVTLNRSTDHIYVGIQPHVVSNIVEAAGVDPRRVEIVARSGSQDPTIHHVARRLLRERQTSGLGGRLYADALVTELVIHLLREYSSLGARENGDFRGVTPAQLRPALEMIHDDLQANLSLKTLAEAARLSPHHFSRVFKRVTGFSPHQYALWQRVQLARRLLVETTLPIAEVAHRAGFYDQSHFTYHFKRLVGTTPRAMRNRENVLSE